jgi:hypothetical protein
LIPFASAAVVVPLHYNADFVLPDIPLLQQSKFLDLDGLPHLKRQLALDLGGILNLGPTLDFVLDRAWNFRTLATTALQGTPNAWYSEIQIGTPSQTLRLVLDSGSTDMAVYDPSCRSCLGANDRTPYQWPQSSTFKRLKATFQAQYGSSGKAIAGYAAKDVVTLAGCRIPGQTLAMITNSSFVTPFAQDGLIGLAQPALAAISGTATVFDQLISQRKIEAPLVGIALRQSLSGDGGEYSFGEINWRYARGPITYLPVTSSLYWCVLLREPPSADSGRGTALGDVMVNRKSVLTSADPMRVIFDTGTVRPVS